MGEQRADNAFVEDGATNVLVDAAPVHYKINAIHRALVAHSALNHCLTCMDHRPCGTLSEAIAQARTYEIITAAEQRWLKHFNAEANKAKHDF